LEDQQLSEGEAEAFFQGNPFKSASELKDEVLGWSKILVRRILQKELKIWLRVAAKKLLLTSKMVQ
jgi:hypothetical protein